jgi:predicted nucleic acid-binding protein
VRLVIDASVVIKWIFPDPEREPHVKQAFALLAEVRMGRVAPLQPPHWLAEASAVITRARPGIADRAINLLDTLNFPVMGELNVYKRASRISRELEHHLFDTLYHAVALEHDGILISADDHYMRKASRLGSILPLVDWPEGVPLDSE